MTIADRLEALSAAIDEEAEKSRAARGGGLAFTSAAGGGGKDGAIQPRAESLATVLTQVKERVCLGWLERFSVFNVLVASCSVCW